MTWTSQKCKWPHPESIAQHIANETHSFWLDSNLSEHQHNRHSIISHGAEKVFHHESDLLKEIEYQQKFEEPVGYYGFLSYPSPPPYKSKTPSFYFILPQVIMTLDHKNGQAKIFYKEKNKNLADLFLKKLEEHPSRQSQKTEIPKLDWQSEISSEKYEGNINQILEEIRAGTVYQINYSQLFKSPINKSKIDQYYLKLRSKSKSHLSAFINFGDEYILCNSPETFSRIENRNISTFPIKGTRPRNINSDIDNKLKEELLKSEKDLAELTMIIDLMRNDLGKICQTGSIKTNKLKEIESYQNVHHLVASISGKLKSDLSSLEAISSCFPAGSITGAPKIKAMELIKKYEDQARNIYTGSIGYLAFNGDAHFNVAIRSAYTQSDYIYHHSGAGIVVDSEPEKEFQETLDKAKVFLDL